LIIAGILILVSFLSAGAEQVAQVPAELPNRYGVIGVRVRQLGDHGLAIIKLNPDGPARTAGLRVGDRIVAVPPYRPNNADEFSRCVQSFAPGQTLSLQVEREGELLLVECPVTDVYHLYPLMGEENRSAAAISQRHFNWSQTTGTTEEILSELKTYHQVDADVDALNRALKTELDRYGADARSQDVHFALSHPLKVELQAEYMGASLHRAAGLPDYLFIAQHHLDLSPLPQPPPLTDRPNLHIDTLLSDLKLANSYVDSAFVMLSLAERAALRHGTASLLRRFDHSFLLDAGTLSESESHKNTLRLAKKVQLSPLFYAAQILARYVDTHPVIHWPTSAPSENPPPNAQGNILYARHTPLGWLIIGDTGPNYYDKVDAWCIIDLGGNDVYVQPSEQTSAQRPRARLYIDYAGDDHYIGGSGSALGAVELLIDKKGNDQYRGTQLFQGAAFCGIGMLWDQAGNDIYSGQSAGQGTAFFGAGILVDRAGDDLFHAAHIAQGFGGMRGFGLLVDRSGSDAYLADYRAPSLYGEDGQFAGLAQGVGCGFRGFGSGGLGVLYDENGDDSYQAGEFSQGAGYFFALGLLFDKSGNDTYRGRRYVQGAAAHQAVGLLVDAEGNDRYRTKGAASLGSAWDAAIGYLEDRAGNDIYRGGDLSQGAAAMNGWGILVDRMGSDHYWAHTGQAIGSSTSYWGGRNAFNFGVLIDNGGQLDTYNQADRKNNSTQKTPGIGLFLDR
jgi:hypothetical protein